MINRKDFVIEIEDRPSANCDPCFLIPRCDVCGDAVGAKASWSGNDARVGGIGGDLSEAKPCLAEFICPGLAFHCEHRCGERKDRSQNSQPTVQRTGSPKEDPPFERRCQDQTNKVSDLGIALEIRRQKARNRRATGELARSGVCNRGLCYRTGESEAES